MNLMVWEFSTKRILTRKDPNIVTGDLSRMGYLPNFNHERKNETNLTR